MSSVVNELKEYIKSLNVLLECKANIADFIIKPIESNTYEFDGRRKRFHFVLKVVGTQYEGRADRIVSIISHVEDLKRRIDKQIVVTKDASGGSKAEISFI